MLNPSEQHRLEGNQCFADGKYREAINQYLEAQTSDPTNPFLHSNQANCHLRLKEFEEALVCSSKALELDPLFLKAHLFKADALWFLQRYPEALAVLGRASSIDGGNAVITQRQRTVEKAFREFRFRQAIHIPQIRLDQELVETITVPDNYTGPRLCSVREVDLEFVSVLVQTLKTKMPFHKRYVLQLLLWTRQILEREDTLVTIQLKPDEMLTICGDVHGQFLDLLTIFDRFGHVSDTHHYLFNGDFVDRGPASFEVALVLFSLKVAFPHTFHLARGNHESAHVNKIYGFEEEIKTWYPRDHSAMFDHFQFVFNALPLAHVVQHKIFVVHGGIGSGNLLLKEIGEINRFRDPCNDTSVMHDLLWADPRSENGIGTSARGAVAFGPDVTQQFLDNNRLEKLVRSHEFQEEGYKTDHNGRCITVFSAPNYLNGTNKGAVINYRFDGTMEFEQFQ